MGTPGRRQGAYSQAARVLRILDHLRARRFGVRTADLARDFGVTVRQIRRDLASIEEAGHPLDTVSVDGRAGVRLVEPKMSGIRLSIRERYTLFAVRRAFDILRGTPFHEDVGSIFDKIAASLPDEQRADLEKLGDRFLYLPDGGTKSFAGKEEILDALLTGVIRRSRVSYRYRRSSGQLRSGVLEPYAMVLYKHGLYVLAKTLEAEEDDGVAVKPLAVERFTRAEFMRGETFELPLDLDLERFFDGAFGIFTGSSRHHVVVQFDAKIRGLVEARIWHRSQRLRATPGGGVRLEMDVSDLTQVVQWVVGWGPLAKVLEPPALVARVADEHTRAAALYAR